MNEVAVRDTSAELADYRSAAVQRLGEWAESARAAHEVAVQLVQTSFVPEAFRGKAGEATAAILAGSEVGLSPMAALRAFDVIQGTAAPRAITLRAVVQSLGHEVVLDESTASRCIVRAKRRGSSEWQKVVWTLDRAKGLGLLGKHNWKAQPQAMLVARATSEACRLIAADAILGIGYVAEEIADGVDPTTEYATATPDTAPTADAPPSGTRRMSRPKRNEAQTPQTDGGAEAGHVASDAVDEEPPGSGGETAPSSDDPITKPQLTKLAILARELELTSDKPTEQDRETYLAYLDRVIGHPVESSKELTKHQAMAVIDAMEQDKRNLTPPTDPADASQEASR